MGSLVCSAVILEVYFQIYCGAVRSKASSALEGLDAGVSTNVHLEGSEVFKHPRALWTASRVIYFLVVVHLGVPHQVIYFNKLASFWRTELAEERKAALQSAQGDVLGHVAR